MPKLRRLYDKGTMIITVASGKGGTGKTTFAVNLAYALAQRGDRVRLLDCDVEEPNDHLFVRPESTDETIVEVMKPVWDAEKCTACGKCAEACNYNAIAVVKDKVLIFNELCHSCGVCAYVCPEDAIHEEPAVIGKVMAALNNEPFFFAYGILNIAEALAPAVVEKVKQYIDPDVINIIDASPGTACSVVGAVKGAEIAVLVTEPTPFGLNDLKLAVGLTLKMKVPTGIVINRSDGKDAIIVDYAERIGVPVMGRIPFKREYAEAYSNGQILVEWFPELRDNLLSIFDNLLASAPPVPPEDIFEVGENDEKPFLVGNAPDYKEITVISGKGGTGKTILVGSLAVLAQNKILADNDVDAADLHLLLLPSVREAHDFVGGKKAVIDSEECVACGKCADMCHFNAIDNVEQASCLLYKDSQDGCPTFPFTPFDFGSHLEITKRHLPHWQQNDVTYFVTFRLSDSIPGRKINQWKIEREHWLKHHQIPFSEKDWLEYNELFSDRIQKWLDEAHGECWLRNEQASAIVANALKFFNSERYHLGEWVVMPNHVHVLVTPINGYPLSRILHSWKSYTANRINKLLHLQGTFWQDESYDHIIRNRKQLRAIEKYIIDNPRKAKINVWHASNMRDRQDACPTFVVNELACEGCGLCGYVCPVDAVKISGNITGKWYVSGTDYGPMVHARLGIAEENSGRLVTQVRNRAAQLAKELKMEQILGDGPPGTGCPVIASVSGADLVLIVTEPTVSGVHDMDRVLKLSAHFGIPAKVVINKADLNTEQAERIREIAENSGSSVIGRIPFDQHVNDALMAGKTIVEYRKGNAEEAIRQIWTELRKEVESSL